jgi:hypothetical protein
MSRRSVIGATAAATAAATLGSSSFARVAGAAAGADDPRARVESVGTLRRIDALSAVATGEEVRFFAANALVPNGTIANTSSVTGVRGASPRNAGGGTNYLSASVDVPAGSTLTSIEFVIEGTPQAGRVALIRWVPDSATAFDYLTNQTIPAAVNGITVYSSPLTAPLATVDGLHTYEAFFSDNGVASLTFCNGIRVRYTPPVSGFVPITPARVYDSRLNMAPDANGAIATGSNRTVSVADARDVTTGAITGALVPATAKALAYTLTVAGTVASGFLAVNPGGVTTVSASTINWSAAGSAFANTGVVRIDSSRTVTVVAGGPATSSTHFIIDVVGYYL